MALNNTNIPTASADVVGVFDQNFNQVFPKSRPIRANIREYSRPMEHPVETGVIITDHRIILPTEIDIEMILPANEYRTVYQQIRHLFISAPLLNVQTRATTYKNMLISEIPHEENPEKFNTIPLSLKLKEVLIANPQAQALPPTSVKDPVTQSTVQIGNQQTGTATVLPAPAINGSGSALPQIPGPPNRSTINVPTLPPPSPINNQQYQAIYNAANFPQ